MQLAAGWKNSDCELMAATLVSTLGPWAVRP